MTDLTWTNLTLTDEQKMLLETVEKFAAERVAGAALHIDHDGAVPGDLLAEMGELGLFSLIAPEDLGGSGMGPFASCLALTALARESASVAFTLLAQSTAIDLLMASGHAAAKELVPALAQGETLAAPVVVDGIAAQRGTAALELTGSALIVPNARDAALLVVAARGDGGAALVRLAPGAAGLAVKPEHGTLGLRGAGLARVELDRCAIAADAVLATGAKGEAALASTLDRFRVGVAFVALGLADRATELGVRYSKERIAFGKPLAAQQAVVLKLGEMTARVEAARHLAWHAARLWETSRGAPRGSAGGPVLSDAAILARCAATDAGVYCGDEAIQIHGGYGYTSEYHVERMYRDAKVCELLDQPGEVLKLALARRLLA